MHRASTPFLPDTPYGRSTFAVDVCSMNNCTFLVQDASNWSSIVRSVSACLLPAPLLSMTDLVCLATEYAASSLRHDNVPFAMRPTLETSPTTPPAFLMEGVVTPFVLSRFNDLAINSACRGSGSYSIKLLSPSEFQRTYRIKLRTFLASLRLALRIARTFNG